MSKGLEDVVAATSSITYIDGKRGELLYRGYEIGDLVKNSNYEETAYLVWKGRLPSKSELDFFTKDLASRRSLPEEVLTILRSLPIECNAMDALRIGCAALGVYDDPKLTLEEQVSSIASKVGTMVALIHTHRHGVAPRPPRSDLSFAANLLYMITGNEPDDFTSNIMNIFLILHADHELNASTFAARVVASTLSDVYSAVTAAVGALKGPLHGGANEKVVQMIEEIGKPSNVEAYVREKLAKKQKIMGFGHRVYQAGDPRARILKEYATKLIRTDNDRATFETLTRVQDIMAKEKALYPNIDFYSGFVLNRLGVPTYLFTPVFAAGRTPGWLAHILEQYADNRIIRPVAEYTGPQLQKYVPLDRRSA